MRAKSRKQRYRYVGAEDSDEEQDLAEEYESLPSEREALENGR